MRTTQGRAVKPDACRTLAIAIASQASLLFRIILSLVSPVMRKQLGIAELQYADALNLLLLAYAMTYVGSGMILDRLRDVPQAPEDAVSAREMP